MNEAKYNADTILRLRATRSRLEKEAILAELFEQGGADAFYLGAALAYDQLKTFGVAGSVAKSKPGEADVMTQEQAFEKYEKLADRQITGNAALELVQDVASQFSADTWKNWLLPVLLKNLDCGVTQTTLNKVAKKYNRPDLEIKHFGCQLATDVTKADGSVANIRRRMMVDYKLDGVRCLAIVQPGKNSVRLFSRNGREFHNFGHIVDAIKEKIDTFVDDMVIDGEVMSKTFQHLMTQVNRKHDANASDATLYAFDCLPLRQFEKGGYDKRQVDRILDLDEIVGDVDSPFLNRISYEIVDFSTEEGHKKYHEIWDKAMADGVEGLMLKEVDAPYTTDRSKAWLKAKPTISETLTVVEVVEGTGRLQNMLGAFVCEGKLEDGTQISTNVGSGFSDDQRQEFWTNRESIIGKEVEIIADAVTKNQQGEYSLRFPRFKTFRGFETAEKI